MKSMIKPPQRLYKYSAFTAQHLENLKNQIIYFSSPRGFNDPYDCSTVPTIRIPSDLEVTRVRDEYLSDTSITLEAREQLRGVTTEQMRQMILRSAETTVAEKIKEFSDTRGVSCFSQECNDLLMWAHYGGTYRGFCLEFDTAYFSNIQKVRYSKKMPAFDPIPLLNTIPDTDNFMSIFSSKSPSWKYEKEWRIFHAKVGTSYCYPDQALTGVYFGPEISTAALEIICLILQGQNATVKFWRGTRSKKEFKVDFEQFNYLSYLQAKKSGQLTV
jgi:hypothetical protein